MIASKIQYFISLQSLLKKLNVFDHHQSLSKHLKYLAQFSNYRVFIDFTWKIHEALNN